jgi:hypothetical protein
MKMVSTMEMAVFLYNKALTKRDELFVREMYHKGMVGEITSISDEDIIRLDDLYHQYKERK